MTDCLQFCVTVKLITFCLIKLIGNGSGPMGNPMHSPIPGNNRMNGMPPINPPQQSPHHHHHHPMVNMPPNANLPNPGNMNMMNSNGNNTPVSTNNSNNSPTTSLPSSGGISMANLSNSNNINSLPGSNNGPMTPNTISSAANTITTNSSNMNQNNQMPPHQMGPGGPGQMPVNNSNNMGNLGPMGGVGGPMMPNNNNPMGQMGGGGGGLPNAMGSGQGMYAGPKPMPVSAGKVYPADTPMVFNPQNPNAPPIYPCGVCHKEVHDNDQGLLCESGCNFWFHRYVQ
jgi:collagen type III alpha